MVQDTVRPVSDPFDALDARSRHPTVPPAGRDPVALMANSLPPGKSAGPATALPSPATSQSPGPQNDAPSRRSGGVGNSGASLSSRPVASPRNNQGMRKQHKTRRPKLDYEDAAAEAASVRSANSRKGQTSITHLMNFTLPPRPPPMHSYGYGRHNNYRRNPTWGLGSGYHAVDKARYIHANYRFIVDPRADYSKQALDADTPLDWSNVLQILASAQSQEASCPICLSTPVAPRMARCGHIFCLPCLIRYMHSTDAGDTIPEKKARWKKCPICWDTVYMAETRPLKFFTGQEGAPPRENEDVVLRLMERRNGSTLALPRDGAESLPEAEDVPWYFAAEVSDYARIMKGSEDYMLDNYDRELEDIQAQEREDELMFGDETTWSRKAVNAIRDLKEKVRGIGGPPTDPSKHEEKPERAPIQFEDVGPEFYALQNAAKSGQSRNQSLTPGTAATETSDTVPIGTNTTTHPDEQPHAFHPPIHRASDAPFYFYQALLHYYLSPLDIRILRAAFVDYASFPSTILPRVEHVSTGHVVDDDLRRRAKYLGHLPHGCEVGFLECDWTDVVSPEILTKFRGEIERRRKRNREKAAREEKERVRAEKEEDDKRWAAARRRRPSLSKAREVPPASFSTPPDPPLHPSSLTTASSASSPPWGGPSNRPSGGAFASLASPSTSPTASRTVWGTAAIAPSSPIPALPPPREPADGDGWLQDWELDLLRHDVGGDEGSALATQLSTVHLEGVSAASGASGSASPAPSSTRPAGQKKKKQKKITLMSTTNSRRAA